ncbi:MAG TPA: FKBP-type peptidyl-prolyl cis-trans isomerase [Chryseosolibacter sp.]|nr:FKBP-type peptidyl-prolyl cis-trans isomerase [Chryseosolibacter sp.]
MNKCTYAFVGLLMLLVACAKKEKETPSGLKYTVIKAGDGVLPKTEQIIVFDWMLKDSKDSVWQETFKEGIPGAAQIADSSQLSDEDGLTQMLRMLSKGDSVRAKMSVTEYFSKRGGPVPPEIDSTLNIEFTIKVKEILTKEEFQPFMEAEFKKREVRVFTRDTEDINNYLSEQNVTALQDTSGIQYIIHNTGGGKKPTVDDCVEVKYKGTFLKTGEVFDQQERIAFPLNGVIAGWKLGIPMLGKGDSGTFYIPSKLAYGPQGYPGAIPPDAILIFHVTLLDVKSQFDQATRSCK